MKNIKNSLILLSILIVGKIIAQEQQEALTKYGDAVLMKPVNNNTVNVNHKNITITQNKELKVFPKRIETYGIIFAAMKNVPDNFLNDIGTALQQIFPQNPSLNLKKQQEVLNTLTQYQALIPVLSEHHNNTSETTNNGLEEVSNSPLYSVCDVIMYGVNREAMEVIEHLLHFITDIGLHYQYPKQWSFTDKNSEIIKVMNIAIEKGLYNIDSYKEILDHSATVHQRVVVQEFAYWLISTYWDLQEPYGNIQEDEWSVDNKKQLLKLLPEGYQLVTNTVAKIMRPPSKELLDGFKKYEK